MQDTQQSEAANLVKSAHLKEAAWFQIIIPKY